MLLLPERAASLHTPVLVVSRELFEQEMEFVRRREELAQRISALFGIPPHLLGIVESNVNEQAVQQATTKEY